MTPTSLIPNVTPLNNDLMNSNFTKSTVGLENTCNIYMYDSVSYIGEREEKR
jgi:hypothetical protein